MENISEILMGVVAVAGIGALIYVIAGATSSCPACSEWFVKEDAGHEVLGHRDGYRMKNLEKVTKNSDGEVIARQDNWVQVNVRTVSHRDHYRCTNQACGHQWHSDRDEEHSSYDE